MWGGAERNKIGAPNQGQTGEDPGGAFNIQ